MAEQTISEFLSSDYKSYARYVVESRAIPAFADGLKPSQRKALAAGRRYCDSKAMKVSALAGHVMADMDYHHGDSSIQGAIICMAQEFQMGCPYFDRIGQFGWLYDKAPGAPRYIAVKLSGWSKLLLKDDAELKYNLHEDTGEPIEPRFYLPILPTLLFNSTSGIAVGYSTSFANRNPLEVAIAVRDLLSNGSVADYQLCPYVNGHTGVWSYWHGQFEHCGPWHRKNTTTLSIDGLPINTTLEKYRGFLNSLIDQGFIRKWTDMSSKGTTKFEIQMRQDQLTQIIEEGAVPALFNLIHRLPSDNLTCIMPDNSICRFESPMQVVREFVDFRLKFYGLRKQRILNDIKARMTYLAGLIKFIEAINVGEINFKTMTKHDLELWCQANNANKSILQIAVYNLTTDNLKKHVAELGKLEHELERVSKIAERDMYIADVNELIGHLQKFYVIEHVMNPGNELLVRPSL